MAGDWIKMRIDLVSDPKLVRIMSALHADKFRIIGGLHAVWSVFDAHTEDGILDGYTLEMMDSIIGWPGFSSAMADSGWLIENAGTLVAPNFEEHNGKSAKRRAVESERKKRVRNLSASQADKKRTREEKRREEYIKDVNPLPPSQGKPARFDPESLPMFLGLKAGKWSEWVDYRKKRKLSTTEATWRKQLAQLEAWGRAGHDPEWIIDQSIANGWQGLFEPKGGAAYKTTGQQTAETIAALTGRSGNGTQGTERDITAESARIA